jgi:flagellar FliL protein
MANAETPQPDAAPAGGLKGKLLLVGAIVIGLAIGAGSGALIVGPAAAKTMGFGTPAAAGGKAAKGADHGEEALEGDEHAEDDSASKSGIPAAVMTLENLVLNPAGSGGSRFLLLTVAIEGKDATAISTMQARDAELRDVVLSTMGRKSVDELAEITGRDSIKTELTAALNQHFGKKSVVRVYFPQYVVQ